MTMRKPWQIRYPSADPARCRGQGRVPAGDDDEALELLGLASHLVSMLDEASRT